MPLRSAVPALGLALLGALLLASPSAAQQRRALPGPSSAGPAAPRSSSALRHFDPDLDTQNVDLVEGGGFIFGTNVYGDLAKAVCFDLPEGLEAITLERVDAFLFRAEDPALASYDVVIWEGEPGFDEAEDAGPQTEIYSQTYDILEIEGRLEALPVPAREHVLTAPLVLEEAFCAGLAWAAGAGRRDLGIVHTEALSEPSPFEWELHGDSSWNNVAQGWTHAPGWHAWLEVVYSAEGTSAEGGTRPHRLALSSVHPNPAAERALVRFSAAEAQRVRVEVFDLLGRRVATLLEGAVAAGEHVLAVDASALSPGLYVVRAQGEGFSESRRLVVVR